MRYLIMCVLVFCLMPQQQVHAEDAYMAAGSITWEDSETKQTCQLKMTHGEKAKRYVATLTLSVDGKEEQYSGEGRGSLDSGSFRLELVATENEDVEITVRGKFKSGVFDGKISKKEKRKTIASGTMSWEASSALPELAKASKKVTNYTIEGTYNWSAQGDRQHTVTAVFNETAPGKYSVDFSFTWGDKAHVYKGTAEGSLSDGKLIGSVRADDQPNRQFGFNGTSVKGVFSGDHHEKRGNHEAGTGKITWKPKAAPTM